MMRDHYEGTELDWRFDVGAGPFNSPYRWSPLSFEVDSVEYCNERPIATQQTAFSFVAQMRSRLPNEIGGIFWFGVDDAAQTVYYPIYCGHTEVPLEMAEGNGDLLTFSWTSAFWIHNWVSNLAYTRYSDMSEDMKKAQSKLENQFRASQPGVEQEAARLREQSPAQAVHYLTQYSNNLIKEGVAEWKQLGEYLMVKYIDGVIKREENAEFKRNPYGKPASPLRPGYSNEYYRKIVEQTGEKYKVHPIIE
jgi:dipeptidase